MQLSTIVVSMVDRTIEHCNQINVTGHLYNIVVSLIILAVHGNVGTIKILYSLEKYIMSTQSDEY